MRIAFFTHYTELYGANLSLLALIDGLAERGVHAHVVCPHGGDLLAALEQRGVASAIIPFQWWVSPQRTLAGVASRLLGNLQQLGAVCAQLVRWRTDVVYTNSSVIPIGAMAARRLGLPHVWHVREFGDRDYDLLPDLGARLFRRMLTATDATIFVSRALRQAYLGDAPRRGTRVIYNGVATAARFDEWRRRAAATAGRRQPFTFALVGRFRESKGQAVAIQALALVAQRHPEVRLLLVGDAGGTGDQRYLDGCRALVRTLRIDDHVELWGHIKDPERAFLAADAALMCSKNEAMGRVTVEAMAACRPVIGHDSAGTSELIEPERSGLLYRSTPEALAACMARYVEAPQMARRHGETAWHLARARHCTEIYADQVHAVLRGVTEARLAEGRLRSVGIGDRRPTSRATTIGS